MRALEAVNRGRLELTVWSHEVWRIPELTSATKLWEHRSSLKLPLESRSQLEISPETVFKNALYFKEHRTPSLNTVLQLTRHGYVALHSQYTLDIPCTKIMPTKSASFQSCRTSVAQPLFNQNDGKPVGKLFYALLLIKKTSKKCISRRTKRNQPHCSQGQ